MSILHFIDFTGVDALVPALIDEVRFYSVSGMKTALLHSAEHRRISARF